MLSPVGPIADAAMHSYAYGLDALSVQRNVRAHNLANVNTPGFRAQAVDFSQAFKLASSQPLSEAPLPTPFDAANPPDDVGNTVDLAQEQMGVIEDGLLHELLLRQIDFKVRQTRTAMGR